MAIDVSNSSKKLSEIDVVSSLNDNDLLVFERLDSNGNAISYKLEYSRFKQIVYNQMSSTIPIRSIASSDVNEYAAFAHGHNYTDLSFFPSYGPNSASADLPDESCYMTGKFIVKKYGPGKDVCQINEISTYVPNSIDSLINQLEQYSPYSVGDVKLINIGNMQLKDYLISIYGCEWDNSTNNVSINSNSFDGFVIPNGSTYTCSQNEFKDACKVFAGDEMATSFKVPVLDSFFRFNPGLRNTDPTKKQTHSNVVEYHDHNGIINTNYKFNPLKINAGPFRINTSDTSNSKKDNYLHWWNQTLDCKEKYRPKVTITKIDITANVNSMEMLDAGSKNESYPPYDNVTVLLYIGKK